MHINHSKTPWPSVAFGSYRLWDDGTAWGNINTSNGVYNWSPLDTWVNRARQQNVELTYTFGRTPAWASSSPSTSCNYASGSCVAPANLTNWDNFVSALVTRYKGRIKYYEMWNEPNVPGYWKGTTAQMVEMTSRAANIIHSIDPNAEVVSPGATWASTTAWVWLNGYLTAGAGPYLDDIGCHGYSGNNNAESILTIIDNIQKTQNEHGLNLPLTITEGGWGPNTIISNYTEQAAFLVQRHMLTTSRPAVKSFFWYEWDNATWGTLWDSSNGIHPAGIAYGHVTQWLTGASANGCNKAANSTWTCSFTLANGKPAIAVWNAKSSVSYTPGSQYNQVLGIDGSSNSMSGGNSYTVGNAPVLFTTTSATSVSATLAVTPDDGVAPVAVSASVSPSLAAGLTLKSTSITFGDGTTINATRGTHTYAHPGTYTVLATVTDNKNHTATSSKTVTVTAKSGLMAALSVSPASGKAPLVVSASSSGSKAPGASITSSSINFGDGTIANSSSAAHTFTKAGNYTVTATVKDNLGASSTATVTVTVTSATQSQQPDLTESKVSVTGTFASGGIIRVTDTTSNIGGAAPASMTWFYLAGSPTAQSGTFMDSRVVYSLGSGSSNTATTEMTLPSRLSGTYYVVACANSGLGIKESNYANDCSGSKAISIPR
jgi:PKD repeat protein